MGRNSNSKVSLKNMMNLRLPKVVSGITQSVTQLSHAVTGRGGDGKYFQTTKKGEMQELREELHSSSKEKKKEALKKVIAAMTVGTDVAELFPDVVNCIQTTSIELKKLVYLYIMNYAKAQPELAVLAINTFRKDSLDSNPLIRAMAVRTMGSIHLEQVAEYLVEPLRRACRDTDPYVRKTAATCICKLYSTAPEVVMEHKFINILQDMISDSNPTVVANAIASLQEISELSKEDHLQLTEVTVPKLLVALNEASEWGQVFILDALARYTPPDSTAAVAVLERVTARLNHANAAVVLSTIRLILNLLDYVQDNVELIKTMHRKIGTPLVALLTGEGEAQYVVLRNIALIIQKYPLLLRNEIKAFFCKYTDPSYVKLEKLEILVALTTEANVDQVLHELRDYAVEVDVEFVRRTIRAIGRLAIRMDGASARCVGVLMKLISSQVNYVVEETIAIMKDILRKYPKTFAPVVPQLCEHWEKLDDPEAKASLIWMLGEYAERLTHPENLLLQAVDGFEDESARVRQQILTAAVKIFVKFPSRTRQLVMRVLELSTEKSDDPDLRDRGFIYWRLLSTNPEDTKAVVLAPRPTLTDVTLSVDPQVIDMLIRDHLCTVAAVFHRYPSSFVTYQPLTQANVAALPPLQPDGISKATDTPADSKTPSSVGPSRSEEAESYENERSSRAVGTADSTSTSSATTDLLDLTPVHERSTETTDGMGDTDGYLKSPQSNGRVGAVSFPGTLDFTSHSDAKTSFPGSPPDLATWTILSSPNSRVPAIKGCIHKNQDETVFFHFEVWNSTPFLFKASDWVIQIQPNSFGFAPKTTNPTGLTDLQPDQRQLGSVELIPNVNLSQTPPHFPLCLHIMLRTSLDVVTLHPVPFDLFHVLAKREPLEKTLFKNHWERMGPAKKTSFLGHLAKPMNTEELVRELHALNIYLVVSRENETFDTLYMNAVTVSRLLLLFEIALQKKATPTGIKITLRADAVQLLGLVDALILYSRPYVPACNDEFPILQEFLLRRLSILLSQEQLN